MTILRKCNSIKVKLLTFFVCSILIGCGNDNIEFVSENSQSDIYTEFSTDKEENKNDTTDLTEETTGDVIESEQGTEESSETEETFHEVSDWNKYIPNFNKDSSDHINVTYNNQREISIQIERVYAPMPVAHPVSLCYGVTVDKQTSTIKYLNDYVPSLEVLVQKVEAGEYSVEYGDIQLSSREEIVEYIHDDFNEENWDNYYSNFYLEEDGVCVILITPFSDYSVLKIPFDADAKLSASVNEKNSAKENNTYVGEYYGELFAPYIHDSVDVVYNSEKELSIVFDRTLTTDGQMNPENIRFGITIDQTTNEVQSVREYILSFTELIQTIEAGSYTVIYGECQELTKKEIVEHLRYVFEEENWDKYYSNFYTDKDYVYVIAGDTEQDYSVIRLERSNLMENEDDDNELSLMQKVLLNKTEFYGTINPYEKEYGWHKIEELEGYGLTSGQFGVVDFDHDGEEEVYVYYMDALILHEQDGVVYGYCEPYRGLLRVCTNGTFEGA